MSVDPTFWARVPAGFVLAGEPETICLTKLGRVAAWAAGAVATRDAAVCLMALADGPVVVERRIETGTELTHFADAPYSIPGWVELVTYGMAVRLREAMRGYQLTPAGERAVERARCAEAELLARVQREHG